MLIIGLTGSIGMGKSTVTAQFAALGAKTCNADIVVHRLMGKGGAAVAGVAKHFPQVIDDHSVNRKKLGGIVFHDKQKMALLETVLHPLVIAEEQRFVRNERRKGARLIVLDIPLLFETGGQARFETTVVVTAPAFMQKQRVMKRQGMTEQIFRRIVRMQMPDREKRRRADYIISTGLGKAYSFRQVKALLKELQGEA